MKANPGLEVGSVFYRFSSEGRGEGLFRTIVEFPPSVGQRGWWYHPKRAHKKRRLVLSRSASFLVGNLANAETGDAVTGDFHGLLGTQNTLPIGLGADKLLNGNLLF